jgi:hypothetical protein
MALRRLPVPEELVLDTVALVGTIRSSSISSRGLTWRACRCFDNHRRRESERLVIVHLEEGARM